MSKELQKYKFSYKGINQKLWHGATGPKKGSLKKTRKMYVKQGARVTPIVKLRKKYLA